MYDALTAQYGFACPVHGTATVRLHDFRRVERLAGAAHPAVYRVEFACSCGDVHPGLVTHDDLDWAPLGIHEQGFHNLMTSKIDDVAGEFCDTAVRRIRAGDWPWQFWCAVEDRRRPVFPSAFRIVVPWEGQVGFAAACPSCGRVSANVVSAEHVDVPFLSDPTVGVVRSPLRTAALASVDSFTEALADARVSTCRLAA
jgi:hypothetical protein